MFESPHQLQAPHSIRVWCFFIFKPHYLEKPECHRTLRLFAFLQEGFKMNDQTNMAQLRYLEELKISLVHAGFEPERIEDQHLPVCWEKGRLCRISGKGCVLY